MTTTVSPLTWPDLARVPNTVRARVGGQVTSRLLARIARRYGITVTGQMPAGGTGPVLVLHRPKEFHARVAQDGLIGFGEAYLSGAWDSPDLHLLLETMARDLARIVPAPLQKVRRVVDVRRPRRTRGVVANTRANVAHHYDLSNELFATFLDESMTYSSALFASEAESLTEDLQTAQHRKIDRMLDQLQVSTSTRLLEIGTGWGELAIRAAARGARVTTMTLSVEQRALAQARVEAAGFGDRVEIVLADYREAIGEYDAIASVEMIEAVGHEFWPAYFRCLDRVLAPGGRACVQAIVMPHDRMLATKDTHTWITKYIFPGGFLPSVTAIESVAATHTSLRVTDSLMFGRDYAETLRRWDEAFRGAADRVGELGFDETFTRMWHFYLTYCRAGFSAGYIDVGQFTLTRPSERVEE